MARGRPAGAGGIRYGQVAETLLDNGYAPVPIKLGAKKPAVTRWTTTTIDSATVDAWTRSFPNNGVGLRTGNLIGLDIDVLDPDAAHAAYALAERRFGSTLIRVGQWPKRLLLYRTAEPFLKLKFGTVEFLGDGQQFVAFGQHPGTGQDYYWIGETPIDVAMADLPLIDREGAEAYLAELSPSGVLRPGVPRRRGRDPASGGGDLVRDANGLVIDGRDGWLSSIAYHAVQDVLEGGDEPDPEVLARIAWERFAATTDLARPCEATGHLYAPGDALTKVCDKLRLAAVGRLPARQVVEVEPIYDVPTITVDEGRNRLSTLLGAFSEDVLAWHIDKSGSAPALGVRATVGIGKSRMAKEACLELAQKLKGQGLPSRILVFTPSHALAEEAAMSWSAAGARVAISRGYERTDPLTGEPMCREIDLVRASIKSGLPVRETVCTRKDGQTCSHFATCAKQRNLRAVAEAEVVFAAYDALFSGFAFDHDDVGLLLIDEGCWARAVDVTRDLHVEDIAAEPVTGMGNGIGRGPVGAMADLAALRSKLTSALSGIDAGYMTRKALRDAGLTASDCRAAAALERRRVKTPDLKPDMPLGERVLAEIQIATNARINNLISLWLALADGLDVGTEAFGRVRIVGCDASGRRRIGLRLLRRLHVSLAGKPILHLDATLRPELARTVLPALQTELVEVAAPHMNVRLVSGSFGKSTLCPDKGLAPEESQRRTNRLKECVDYVRWQARRAFPKRVLVITYQAIEAAFEGIPNVDTAHFNAIAGLDCYGDVATLITIGRPLPSSGELEALTGAHWGHVPLSGYLRTRAGVRMVGGGTRGINVFGHRDPRAEALRAAICDDELIQAIGRGRGVNRGAGNPLEVHVLADVALPLEYAQLTIWETMKPDIVQLMLLDGVAVDSPADAAALHPQLLGNEKQAQKAFERGGFKRQNPMSNSYREMSLKSAAYRKPGSGRAWQRAWWIDGTEEEVSAVLERTLGPLGSWTPDRVG